MNDDENLEKVKKEFVEFNRLEKVFREKKSTLFSKPDMLKPEFITSYGYDYAVLRVKNYLEVLLRDGKTYKVINFSNKTSISGESMSRQLIIEKSNSKTPTMTELETKRLVGKNVNDFLEFKDNLVKNNFFVEESKSYLVDGVYKDNIDFINLDIVSKLEAIIKKTRYYPKQPLVINVIKPFDDEGNITYDIATGRVLSKRSKTE